MYNKTEWIITFRERWVFIYHRHRKDEYYISPSRLICSKADCKESVPAHLLIQAQLIDSRWNR